MLGSIKVLLAIFMSLLVDSKIWCLIQSITWISKSLQHLTVTTFISNFTEREETLTAKIGKEETLFRFVSLHQIQFSTKTLGLLSISLVTDSLFLSMYPNGSDIKLFQMQYLMALSQKYMEAFQDLHSNLKYISIDQTEILQEIKWQLKLEVKLVIKWDTISINVSQIKEIILETQQILWKVI